jgi:hypothetical protein
LRKRLQKWAVKKKVSPADKNRLIGIYRRREKMGKNTVIRHRGELYSFAKLQRHIHVNNLSEEFLISLELCVEGN